MQAQDNMAASHFEHMNKNLRLELGTRIEVQAELYLHFVIREAFEISNRPFTLKLGAYIIPVITWVVAKNVLENRNYNNIPYHNKVEDDVGLRYKQRLIYSFREASFDS